MRLEPSNQPTEGSFEARLERAERGRFEAEAKYQALVSQLPAAVYMYSPELDGPTFHMSPYVQELFGVSAQEFLERDDIWDALIHPEDRERSRVDYECFLRTGQPEHGEYRYVRPDGRIVWVRDHSVKVCDADGTPMFVQGVLTDITPSKEAELRMEHLAFHDSLTGLPNRAMFEQHLELALARARRDGSAAAVVFLDLDDFKPVNDTHGHATGDEMLRQVGARLRSAVRETDLVARQGGDEFLVLIADLPPGVDMTDANKTLETVVQRIHRVLSDPFPMRVGELAITASVGHALFPSDAEKAEVLLRLADEAMYRHKRNRSERPRQIRRTA